MQRDLTFWKVEELGFEPWFLSWILPTMPLASLLSEKI